MPLFSSLQIPPPANWQDFEDLCYNLWRLIWEDQNTQKNGRQGQPQHGVDICGRPSGGPSWAGVQCKGKDNYADKGLTEDELIAEVEKAKSFHPKISEYIIATTGSKDEKIEEIARELTDKHRKKGLFSVHVLAWKDIVLLMSNYPDILDIHFPGLSLNTKAIKQVIADEVKETADLILKSHEETRDSISSLAQEIHASSATSHADLSTTVLTPEYQRELDYSRELLESHKPKQAQEYLERLKDRIWLNAQPIVKYRILTNLGGAKICLDKKEEAAKLFVQALQFNAEEEQALSNAALGHMILNNRDNAQSLLTKALKKNPTNGRAYSIRIQLLSNKFEIEKLIEDIPESLRKTPEVAFTIAMEYRKGKRLLKAKEWLEIAVKSDKEVSPEIEGTLGDILIALVIGERSIFDYVQINDEKEQHLKRAIKLLTTAYERLGDEELKKLRLLWIVNRGIAKRLLGDLKEAINDIDFALKMDPTSALFILYSAVLSHEIGNTETAIKKLESIVKDSQTPKAPVFLAELLYAKGEIQKSIDTLESYLQSNPPQPDVLETKRLLIKIYIDGKRLREAKAISDELRSLNPTDIKNLVDAAKISEASGRKDEAYSLLQESKRYINKETPFRALFELASAFNSLEQFEEEANILERITDTSLNSPLTRNLLDAYYQAGLTGKALGICKSLREKYGALKFITAIESAIYENIGDLVKAENVCKEYLRLYPNDFEMGLRLATVYYSTNNIKELDDYLAKLAINIRDLPFKHGLQLASLYAERKNGEKALQIIYEMRRKNFSNPDAHLKYLGILFRKDLPNLLEVEKVTKDTAVCIESEHGGREWYIIEDRDDADISRREFSIEHKLAKALIGKSRGDDILLIENPLARETGKIIDIKSKYLYAFHETIDKYEKLFPDAKGFWTLKMAPHEKKSPFPKEMQALLKQVTQRHEAVKKVEQLYMQRKLTIGAFSRLLGVSVIEVWRGIVNRSDLRIFCSIGTNDERNTAIALLSNEVNIIIDIISLLTIHFIKAEDAIARACKILGISQTTVDLLRESLYQHQQILANGFSVISKDEDKYLLQDISADTISTNIEFLNKVLAWVGKHCEVTPCKKALDIKRERKRQLDDLLGAAFVDTILIAGEPGNILFSEDERLRTLAKGEFNVDGVWTQIVLHHCLEKGIVDKREYNSFAIDLVKANHIHTSIDADILLQAANQSNWVVSEPYSIVSQTLSGNQSDEDSAIGVATNFMYMLWRQPILAQRRDYLILNMLDTLTNNRNRRQVIGKLISFIKMRFKLIPLAERELSILIKAWLRMHIG